MLAVSHHGSAESFFGAFHEVVAATTVAVELNAARHYMHAQSVDSSIGAWLNVAVLAYLNYA